MVRLASSVLVSGLIRSAESRGGFAAVLAKGDPNAGAVLIILTKGGRKLRILERLLQPDGNYLWQDPSSQAIDKEEEIDRLVDRRRKHDPDLWLLELDIPSPERFAAEMNASN
ncbi:MAG TPA: DUF1491 family protein [Allosphingosinicella sp.]|nr:DUF1491 family protein [Allosphingosinicella sp.]